MSRSHSFQSATPRIAVLVDTSTTWGRGILKGIHSYCRNHESWHLYFEPGGLRDPVRLPQDWKADGIIARISSDKEATSLRRQKAPVINVSSVRLSRNEFATVSNDVEAVAKMAVDYFLERGYRNFAYLSLHGLEYVVRQSEAFVAEVRKAGCHASVKAVNPHFAFHSPDWNLKIGRLATWLESLPKPVALLTWSGGKEIIHACLQAGLRVPNDVALLSGSEDELICGLSPIPISGVQAACEQIGYQAAALLSYRMRARGRGALEQKVIAPLGVVTRQSTDTFAIEDAGLLHALNFIQEHRLQNLGVDEVARASGLSRSVLERRFRGILGQSPAAYIAMSKIRVVKKYLSETNYSIAQIAEMNGYCSPEYMSTIFKKMMRTTPLGYRRESRPS